MNMQVENEMSEKDIVNNSQVSEYDRIFDNVKNQENATSEVLRNFIYAKYKPIIVSIILYIIKHSPVYVMPIGTAEIINIATYPEQHSIVEMYVWGWYCQCFGCTEFVYKRNLHKIYQ